MREDIGILLGIISAIPVIGWLGAKWREWRSPLHRFIALRGRYSNRANEDPNEKRLLGTYLADTILTRKHPPDSPAGASGRSGSLVVFIESGTTAAELGLGLLGHDGWTESCKVFTTNLLVSLAFAGRDRACQCFLLPGEIDPVYPGVVGSETVRSLQELLGRCDVAVMNTTAFDVTIGPSANSVQNRDVKKAILENAQELYICFTSSKLLGRSAHPVLDEASWRDLLTTGRVHLIVTAPRKARVFKRSLFKDRYDRMIDYLEKRGFAVVPKAGRGGRVRHLHIRRLDQRTSLATSVRA